MDNREKLIKLIQDAVSGCARYWAGLIADHLLKNGVALQPVNKEMEEPPMEMTTKELSMLMKQGIDDLAAELEAERYRHDRLQDFEVASAKQYGELKARYDALVAKIKEAKPCDLCNNYDDENGCKLPGADCKFALINIPAADNPTEGG